MYSRSHRNHQLQIPRGVGPVNKHMEFRSPYLSKSPFYLDNSEPCGFVSNSHDWIVEGVIRNPYQSDGPAIMELLPISYVPHLGTFLCFMAFVVLLGIGLFEVRDCSMLKDVIGNMANEHSDAEGYLPFSLRVHQMLKAKRMSNFW